MNSILCVNIAFAIYFIYNVISLVMFGPPWSLSKTYYLFKSKRKCLRILFPLMMFSVTFLLLPAWLEISEYNNLQFTAFLAAGGILFTGAAPAFNNSKLENNVHTFSAFAAALFAILWIIFVSGCWTALIIWFILILIISIITNTYKTSYVYWLETVAFMATFTSIINYFYS